MLISMSVSNIDEVFKTLDVMAKRKQLIIALYPDMIYSQSEIVEKTGIASSNMSKYLAQLEEKSLLELSYGMNARGQTIKRYSLSKVPLDVIKASSTIVSTGKLKLTDIKSLTMFLDSLLLPELEEYSLNSIQLLSNQYFIPVDSVYFTFIQEHIMDPELDNVRRVLVTSTKNFVSSMEEDEKRILADRLKPALAYLLDQASGGLETETKKLLEALGVYNLPYIELEELYLRDITRDKDPSFYRRLILQNYHNRVPRLRARLMALHLESPNSIRSKIRQELPHIR